MSNYRYKKYKQIKDVIKHLNYRGYPISNVIGSYIAGKVWRENWSFKDDIFRMLQKPQINMKYDCKDVLVTYRIERPDYVNLLKLYTGDKITAQKIEEPNKINLTLSNLFSTFFYIFKAFAIVVSHNVQRKYISLVFSNLVFALKVIDYLENRNWECKSYFAFNSSHGLESFISFYFRKKGIKTYSIQHAAYYKYENSIPKDIINYENVCAETLLVWGSYTSRSIKEFLPNNTECLVYGYPLIPKAKTLENRKKDNRFLVALPRKIYFEESKKLLESLASTKYKYLVRPHPSVQESLVKLLRVQNYDNLAIDLTPDIHHQLGSVEFNAVISFNSSIIFQSVLHDQIPILYRTKKNEFSIPGIFELSELGNFNRDLGEVLNHSPELQVKLKGQLFSQIEYDLFNYGG